MKVKNTFLHVQCDQAVASTSGEDQACAEPSCVPKARSKVCSTASLTYGCYPDIGRIDCGTPFYNSFSSSIAQLQSLRLAPVTLSHSLGQDGTLQIATTTTTGGSHLASLEAIGRVTNHNQ